MVRIPLEQLTDEEKWVIQLLGNTPGQRLEAGQLFRIMDLIKGVDFDHVKLSEAEKFLTALRNMTRSINVSPKDIKLRLINNMEGNGLLEFRHKTNAHTFFLKTETLRDHYIKLTDGAKAYFENMGKDRNPVIWSANNQIFIACAFGQEDVKQLVDNNISPLIDSYGYRPLIMSNEKASNSIDEAMREAIRNSYAFVADLTYARPSVYYEAGFAKALGMPTFLTCRKDHEHNAKDTERIHFDLRNHTIGYWEIERDNIEWTGNPLASQFESALKQLPNNVSDGASLRP